MDIPKIDLSKDVFALIVYCLPGLVANACRYAVNDRPGKREEWLFKLEFALWGVLSWLILYLLSKLVCCYALSLGVVISPVHLDMGFILSNVSSLLVLPIGLYLGLFLGALDNSHFYEWCFSEFRALMNKPPASRKSVFEELLCNADTPPVVRVSLNGSYTVGVVQVAECCGEQKTLYVLPFPQDMSPEDVLDKEADGTYVDLDKGYCVEVFLPEAAPESYTFWARFLRFDWRAVLSLGCAALLIGITYYWGANCWRVSSRLNFAAGVLWCVVAFASSHFLYIKLRLAGKVQQAAIEDFVE